MVEMAVCNHNHLYPLYREIILLQPLLYGSYANSGIYQQRALLIPNIVAVSAAAAAKT